MILEALVLAFLAAWLINEYMNNIYMQLYFNSVIGVHLTTYTMLIGVVIGLGGTVTAFTLWKNLRETRVKLENISSPRLRGSVRKILSALPTIDEETSLEPRHSRRERSSTTIIRTSQTSAPPTQDQPTDSSTQPLPPVEEPQNKQP
jgi:uncharacterized membrane protein YgaE (UPF0421/DUF939 family)